MAGGEQELRASTSELRNSSPFSSVLSVASKAFLTSAYKMAHLFF